MYGRDEARRASSYLAPEVEVRAVDGALYLEHRVAGVRHRVSLPEALSLSFLAATSDADDAARAVCACLEDDSGALWVRRARERYRTYLSGTSPREVDLGWLEKLEPADLRQTAPDDRLAAPAAVTWAVTFFCNRRCLYCCVPVRPHPVESAGSPPDALLPLPRALRLVDQMALAGAADLYLTGGEPLLRRDLAVIIRAASDRRIRAHLTTKYPIREALAETLAEAGLFGATLSLDDARADCAARLTGPGYLAEATQAIRALAAAGVPVTVHAVVTRVNRDGLDELAELAADLGAERLTFGPPSFPGEPERAARLLPPEIDWSDRAARLGKRCSGRLTVEAVGAPVPTAALGDASRRVCASGFSTLDVLPDGRVTLCRLLPDRESLIVGDLRHQDLAEVWNGKRLMELVAPPPERFAGSACAGCAAFDACNRRGRCYLQALEDHGRLYAPDPFCTLAEGA